MTTGQHTGRDARGGNRVVLLLVIVLLNGLLTFQNVWPTPWIRPGYGLSIELGVALLVLAFYAQRFGPPPKWVMSGLATVLVLLVIGRYAAVTAPALYGRPVNLYWDAQHIPAVVAMVAEAAPRWLVLLATAVALGLVVSLYGLVRWSLGQVRAGLGVPGPRYFLLALGAGLSALYFGGRATEALRTDHWFAAPVSRTYAEQAGFLLDALRPEGVQALPDALPPSSTLARVRETDVFVVFIESYGATAFDTPRFRAVLDKGLGRLEAAIGASGLGVVSAFLRSPTFGSGSWRAHLSFLSGVEVGDERTYRMLLTTDRDTLVDRFRAAGHRALALMPGLKRAWPEGAFFRFDRIYGEADLDYRGPGFGWWRIPDQYTLARFHEREVRRAGRSPLFVVFPTITSHAPFRPTPPYQPDWDRLLTDVPYGAGVLDDALERKPDWTDLGAGYADAMNYSLSTVSGYLRRYRGRDLVMIVLGDHQPPASVSGTQASWEVPVHVIASDPAILGTLVRAGFREGLGPRRPALGDMHELGPLLLAAFGAGTDGTEGLPVILARAAAR